MGFLDKAKEKIATSFGDETVRTVSFQEEVPEQEPVEVPEKPSRPQREKPQKPAKAPKPPKPEKVKEEKDEDSGSFFSLGLRKRGNKGDNDDNNLEIAIPAKPEKPQKPAKPEKTKPEPKLLDKPQKPIKPQKQDVDEDSVFDPDEGAEDFFEKKQAEYDQFMTQYEGVPNLQVLDGRIQDVLQTLDIPPTFIIEKDVFIPEDLEGWVFDEQMPVGYEMGQVNFFVSRTKESVARYIELLKLRNEHVAKLATVVDKLQVDAHNLKYQAEIASGINVLPSSDADNLENQLLDARLENRRLEDRIKMLEAAGQGSSEEQAPMLSAKERARYDDLQDQYAILRRENEDLREENYQLKSQLAMLDEDMDNDNFLPPTEREDEEDYRSEEGDKEDSALDLPEDSTTFYMEEESEALPEHLQNDDFELPAIEPVYRDTPTPRPQGTAFYDDDEEMEWNPVSAESQEVGSFESELIDTSALAENDDPFYASDTETTRGATRLDTIEDEEEDEVDKLMKEWGATEEDAATPKAPHTSNGLVLEEEEDDEDEVDKLMKDWNNQ